MKFTREMTRLFLALSCAILGISILVITYSMEKGRSSATASESGPLRLLYWNIQNGMWADQPNNYDNFVSFVKEQNPDICVWCEAKSLYYNGTADGYKEEMERYLPDNWDELAARYGHRYVYIGGNRDGYPQAITSRYPIRNVKRIVGERPDSVVTHGAGWAQIDIDGKTYNIVSLHTWPQKFAFEAENKEESAAKNEGDSYRQKEIAYICGHTISSCKDANRELWLMMGDFNSVSRLDYEHYGVPQDTVCPMFLTQDWILRNTPYKDVVFEQHGKDFQSTVISDKRIDYIYASPAMMSSITSSKVIRTGFPSNRKLDISNFCDPSDHLPILIEFSR